MPKARPPRRAGVDHLRENRPDGHRRLRTWIKRTLGVRIADAPVCCGHDAPWDYFSRIFVERPPLALVLGPRGGGKSFLSALDAHLASRFRPNHGTRILGGSLSQSE